MLWSSLLVRAAALLSVVCVATPTTFVYLADLHVGEGCNSSHSDYAKNDTACYSVRDLNRTIGKINELVANASLIIIGGDITASAQRSEFEAAKAMLDHLESPYLPTLGNHDIWSYDEVSGDRTKHPVGDALFAEIFAPVFAGFSADRMGSFVYPNVSGVNPTCSSATNGACHSTVQSWEFRPSAARFGSGLAALTFLAPDFSTREKALPPCPGHSPIGGCGVNGMAALNNFTNGSLPWFEHRLRAAAPALALKSVFLATHQPFRCRALIPDWYFCFSTPHKAALRAIIDAVPNARESFWGQLAGHQVCYDVWPLLLSECLAHCMLLLTSVLDLTPSSCTRTLHSTATSMALHSTSPSGRRSDSSKRPP